jgi:hypothetical protein
MKQFPKIKIAATLAVLLACLAAASCDNSYSVLGSIQTEKAQVGTTLFKNATVKALGEDAVHQKFFAVMSKIYRRGFDETSWSLLPVNGVSDYYAAGFASDAASGKIWVASANAAGTSYNGIFVSSDGGTTWSAVTSTAMGAGATISIDSLYWAGDTLYALTHDHSAATYSLFYSDGASAFAAVTGLASMSYPVIGIVKAGTSYWTLTQARVYTGTSNSFAADATSGTPTGSILTSTSGSVLGGIAADTAGSVLVTRSDGLLYTLPLAGTWSSGATVLDSVKLGILAEVPTTKGGSEYRILVAKHNSTYGYCEWNATTSTEVVGNDDSAIFSPTSSGYTTTVYDKPVTAFHYSSANGTILIGLAAQGSDTYALYSNTYASGAWSGWTAE